MQFRLTGSQENTSADLRKKVIYLQSNLTLQQVVFSNIPTYFHKCLPSSKKWWNYGLRWPLLVSNIIQLSGSVQMGISEARNCLYKSLYHGMTLRWEVSHHFLYANKMRWCPPKLSWCPLGLLRHEKPPPQTPDIWWSKVTLHPIWYRE